MGLRKLLGRRRPRTEDSSIGAASSRHQVDESAAAAPKVEATQSQVTTSTHPLGPKVLASPENTIVDIVFLHGLTGHRDRTWTAEEQTDPWPKTLLPQDIPDARIITYGYDADVVHWTGPVSQNTVREHAQNLVNDLNLLRKSTQSTERPIVFVVHSLGGLVCQDALLVCQTPTEEDQRDILASTHGVAFLGTPHAGGNFQKFARAVADIISLTVVKAPNKSVLKVLDQHSDILANIKNGFLTMVRNRKNAGQPDLRLHAFIEERPVKGLGNRVVDSDSAMIPGYNSTTIPADHMDMTKFATEDDIGYQRISRLLSDWIRVLRASEGLGREKTCDEKDCLMSLYFSAMEDRQHDITRAEDGTCAWLLQHEDFQRWLHLPQGLLWIRGKPGAGKSTLLKYALQDARKTAATSPRKVLILSFFFHGRGADLQKSPLGLFRSLLHQLLDRAPNALSSLVKNFKHKCRIIGPPGEKWDWHLGELQDTLGEALPIVLKQTSIRIFIDALDECGEDTAKKLVDIFQGLVSKAACASQPFSICFSCRHYPILVLEHGLCICVERENTRDITTYVRKRLKDTSGDLIVERASGVFQWAVLVVDRVSQLKLEGKGPKAIESEILRIPRELHALYRELLNSISGEEREEALKLIQWVYFAIRPLSLQEIRWAMVVDAGSPYQSLRECLNAHDYPEDDGELERRVKTFSRGLLEIMAHPDGQVVQFIHQTVQDFLVADGLQILDGTWKWRDLAVGHAHYRLSRSCIRYIDMEEIRQCAHKDRKMWISSFPFLEYATKFWLRHAARSESNGISQADIVVHLHWPSSTLARQWITIYEMLGDVGVHRLKKGSTLIHLVAKYSLPSFLSAMLKTLDSKSGNLNSDCEPERTAPPEEVDEGHEALLNEDQMDINAKTGDGWTAMHFAAWNGRAAIVRILLEHGADVSIGDGEEWTALHRAAERGHEEVVRILLKHRADVNVRDKNGGTALHYAAYNGHQMVVRRLLEHGADVSIESGDGCTAQQLAAGYRDKRGEANAAVGY